MCSFCIIRYKLETEHQYESNYIRISTSWRLGFENNYVHYMEGNFGHHCINQNHMFVTTASEVKYKTTCDLQ